jgi:hypothetical protein
MPPAGKAETKDSRAGASSAKPVAPRSRKFLAGVVSTKAIVEAIVSSPIVAFFMAVGAALLGFLALWLFALVPELWPWAPYEERRVSISDAKVAERRFTRPDDGEEVTVVTFTAEAVGYAADRITVATLWIDPLTDRRVAPTLELHADLVSTAKANQSIGWLHVPYPTLPAGVHGCLVLRVLLLLAPEGGLDVTDMAQMVEPTQDVPLLAYMDTAPFEPYEDGSCAVLERMGTPETG